MLIALLTLVCVITYTFEIVFGLAGTIMMLMVMGLLVDTKTLVIYSVLPQVLVAVIGLVRSPRTVELRFLSSMLVFAAAGVVAGLFLFYTLSLAVFQVLLAGAITLFGAWLVIAPHTLRIPPLLARGLDSLAGVSQALFGISGPIAMTRLLGTFGDKTVVRNYALAFFLSLNLLRGGGYLVNGTITAEIGRMMLWSGPVIAIALWFSNHLHFRINEQWFRRVVAWIILAGGVGLFFY